MRAPAARLVLELAGLVLLAADARAQVVDLAADLDNTLYAPSGSLSNGSGRYLFAGVNAQSQERRALLRFDVSGIPAGATVHSVSLVLFMNRTHAFSVIDLHRSLEPWGEGGSQAPGEEGGGGPAQDGDATWTHGHYPGCAWSAPGGAFASVASSSSTINIANGFYAFTGAGMTADVQAWIDGARPNHGWILMAQDPQSSMNTKRFASRQFPDPTLRPRLMVTYTQGSGCGAVNYCGPAVVSSSGCPARTWWAGSCSVAADNFTITAEGLPAGRFGYFVASRDRGASMPGSSSGLLCLGSNVASFDAPGQLIQGPAGQVVLDLSAFPTSPAQAVLPGDTWNFQCWYRDAGPTSNFSDGLQVTFD